MSHAVIGLGFGDEGKGLVTDLLCSPNHTKFTSRRLENRVVVRYSGGQNAGHTVVIDNKRHVFSNFGSGSLRGVPTFWSKYCTVDPVGIVNELGKLLNMGVTPRLYIDPMAPVTTPYDKYKNQQSQKMLDNGTCGVGVGTTFQREEDFYHLRFFELYNKKVFNIKLRAMEDYYGFEPNLERFRDKVETMKASTLIETRTYDSLALNDVIFEGSQGLLLDQHYGFFPHVTRSNVGTKNILEMGHHPNLFLVMRAYQTRHGNGPMTNTGLHNIVEDDPRETNVDNKYQGEFRKSVLDLDLISHGITADEYIRDMFTRATFVVTCVDHLKEYAFTYENKIWSYKTKTEFLQGIKDCLGIKYLLYSESPESSNIKRFK